jgi:hypothetical protein
MSSSLSGPTVALVVWQIVSRKLRELERVRSGGRGLRELAEDAALWLLIALG